MHSAFAQHNRVVLEAATGAGKTTRIPPALLQATKKRILVLEPRRVAARAAAARIAEEQGWVLGETVGYQIRFDKKWRSSTRILFVTEGVLLRMLQDDPFLSDIGCVVLDEFHERSLASDTALALLRSLQDSARNDLLLLVMSATFDTERLSDTLSARTVRSAGRTYPVDIVYQSKEDRRPLAECVAAAVLRSARSNQDQTASTSPQGSILAFLPGIGEILRTRKILERNDCPLPIFELYGDLPLDQQHAVLRNKEPRIVLATNVAETSVTVDGVTTVVDTGVHRQLRFDATSGIDRLELLPISRASADQRAGRAGRQSPGLALRLWTASEHSVRRDADPPEIHRIDFSATALYLLDHGESPEQLPWLDPPKPASMQRSHSLLVELGALGPHSINAQGRAMAGLPVHPRLALLLLKAQAAGLAHEGALLAALLSERDVLSRPTTVEHQATTDSDLLDRLDALHGHGPVLHLLHRGRAHHIQRVARQLVRLLPGTNRTPSNQGASTRNTLSRCLLAAFPDRLALFPVSRHTNAATSIAPSNTNNRKGRLVGGGGVQLGHSRVLLPPGESQLVLCLELGGEIRRADRRSTAVHSATLIERQWLDKERLCNSRRTIFDPTTERVSGLQQTLYLPASCRNTHHDQTDLEQSLTLEASLVREDNLALEESLVLEEREYDASAETIEQALLVAALQQPARALGLDQPALVHLSRRLRFVHRFVPTTAGNANRDVDLPVFNAALWAEQLPAMVAGCRSFSDLRKVAKQWIPNLLSFPQQQLLNRLAPERVVLPNHRTTQIDYPDDHGPPILAAQIQDLFGWQDTPTIANGTVPLLLHLLAPNRRPQQITDDLRGFWTGSYTLVRKDLAGRYPKHPWPKDPLNAAPRIRRPKPRKK